MNTVPTKQTPVSGDSLKLAANEKGMSWCRDRLRKDTGRKTKVLSIFQTVPLYYAALAVKREHKMTVKAKNTAVVRAYKYAASAFLAYLQEQHDFQAPSWLTIGVMGCTTLSAQGEKEKRYYDEKRDTAWNRYVEIQRQIRAQWMPWVNNYVVNSQSSRGSLPSGTQEEDMWKDLHLFLFRETNTSKNKIKREDYLRRLADGEELDIIEQETADNCEAKAAGAGESPRGKQEKITENTALSGTSETAASSGAPNDCDSSSMKGSAATASPSSPRFEAKDKQAEVGDTVTVRLPMPDAWLHTFSLVFACYGHFADHPDPDLDLSLSDGPLDEKSGQDSNESNGSLVNSEMNSVSSQKIKTLRGRSYPNEALSRGGQKKQKTNEVKEARAAALTARLANAIERSSEDACEKEAVAAVQKVGAELEIANGLRRGSIAYAQKDKKIGWMLNEIQLLKDVGDEKGAKVAQRRLLELMRSPVHVETPSGRGGRDSGDIALLTRSGDSSNVGCSANAPSDPSAVGDRPLDIDGRPQGEDACGSSNGLRDPHFGCGAAIQEIDDDVPVSEGDDSDCVQISVA